MSFLIAVVGRYQSGKTRLCNQLKERGLHEVKIEELLLKLICPEHIGKACQNHLLGRYESLSQHISNINDDEVLQSVSKALEVQCIQGSGYVEVPSCLDIERLMVFGQPFKYIVAVDCPDEVRDRYMEGLSLDKQQADYLRCSGFSRRYYTSIATDIFLNTVDEFYIEWVTQKILSSYRLLDIYVDQ